MNTLVILLALATFIFTIIGGSVTVKFKKYLPYFFAFASGTLISVAFLDLLPESLELSTTSGLPLRYIFISVVFSFFLYSLIERLFATHELGEEDHHGHIMGPIGAGSLVIHSFLDGAAIGAAFQVNTSAGLIVALAVIFHDFTDGINTVTLMLKNKQKIKNAIIFLVFDAIAPVFGVLATTAILIPQKVLAIILAVFVGEFIYLGASTLLPETQKHKSKAIILAILLGILLITILTSLI
jgi:zinc transporter ZupT